MHVFADVARVSIQASILGYLVAKGRRPIVLRTPGSEGFKRGCGWLQSWPWGDGSKRLKY